MMTCARSCASSTSRIVVIKAVLLASRLYPSILHDTPSLYPHGCHLFRKIDKTSNTTPARPSKSRILSTPWRAVAPWIPGEHTPSRPPGLKDPVHIYPPTGVRIVSLRVGMPKLGSKLPQNQ